MEDERDTVGGGGRRLRGIAAAAALSSGASTIVNQYFSGEQNKWRTKQ